MIPQPPPAGPLLVLLSIALACVLFAGYKTARLAAQSDAGSKPRLWGIILAAIAGAASCGLVLLTAMIAISSGPGYQQAVWMVLADSYGVAPVSQQVDFRPGVEFPAIVGGEASTCMVHPPETVVCGGEVLTPPLDGKE